MAAGWVSLLRLVPWGEVVRNAPKVAEGARGLWDKVSGKAEVPPVDGRVQDQLQAEKHAIERLREQVQATGEALSELQAQMLTATQLINDLADQNAQLVREVGRLRTLLRWTLGLTVLLVGAGLWALLGPGSGH